MNMYRLSDDELLQELKLRFVENKTSLLELKELNGQLLELNKKLEESESLKSHIWGHCLSLTSPKRKLIQKDLRQTETNLYLMLTQFFRWK